ncbi:dUTP diphosphatase [Schinkia sp. CFF1]
MNLEKLLEMQKVLDNRIIKEKGLEGQDLTLNTVNALIVELSEFANEGRWFKHWSNDQEPRLVTEEWKIIKGAPIKSELIVNEDAEVNYAVVELVEKQPLIEEYVDSLHFLLSLANTKCWKNCLYLHEESLYDLEEAGFSGGLSGAFLEMNYWLLQAFMTKDRDEKLERNLGITKQQFGFRNAWFLFIAIGTIGFNFSLEEIEQAYIDKNKVNHQRQEEGY